MLVELFWLSFVLFFHTWVGYPLVLKALSRANTPSMVKSYQPPVSVVITVHNGADKIIDKLNNTQELDYPSDKIEIIVVSDGSTDDTVSRVKTLQAPNVFVYELTSNQGKSVGQNFGVKHAKNEIIVFTDVDSVFSKNFLRKITPYFADPNIACVGGKALLRGKDGNIARSQGLYWRVEQFIREAESELGMLHSLPGWGFAVRRSDFVPLDPDTGDDMILPMEMALRGKRSVIAPYAVVSDYMPSSLKAELKARQRITLRNLTGLMKRKALLVPWQFPRISFAIWSHKLLRWLSPVFMLTMLFSSLWLSLATNNSIYDFLWFSQTVFYFLGIVGIVATLKGKSVPVAGHVSSFLVANYGFFLGLVKFITGQKIKSYGNINQ